jgi:hypothetical protein
MRISLPTHEIDFSVFPAGRLTQSRANKQIYKMQIAIALNGEQKLDEYDKEIIERMIERTLKQINKEEVNNEKN